MSNVSVAAAASTLASQGTLSKPAASLLSTYPRHAQVPDLTGLRTNPHFTYFLIDASESMLPYRSDVIDCQHTMIENLRNSAECKRGALFVAQYLFTDRVEVLNPLTQLGTARGDGIKLLDISSYDPKHGTALYKSLFYTVQDIVANIANADANGFVASCTVGVMTNGEDTEGGIQPSEIKDVLNQLQSKAYLRTSVLLALVHQDFTGTVLEELKACLLITDKHDD